MLPNIAVRAAGGDADKYRDLLRNEWSRQTLDGVLSLLLKLIAKDLKPAAYSWQKVLKLDATRKSAKVFDPQIIDRIRDLSLVIQDPSVPATPDNFTADRPSRSAARAEQVWSYLMLQAMANLDGAVGLFADAQSLLFLCSAQFLLPRLLPGLTAEHDCLVCAMYLHTILVWKMQPEHMYDLQAVLMGRLGNAERRLVLLETSFLLTSPQDHAYLTRATTYWSALMELGRPNEALEFLFSLTRRAPDSCQEEIKEMLTETAVEAQSMPA